ncbi:hypothetical protein [Brasilonema sp. UFV-L1]|nr:hypothetical protein [Brasilonema sp. UFV-L1]
MSSALAKARFLKNFEQQIIMKNPTQAIESLTHSQSTATYDPLR